MQGGLDCEAVARTRTTACRLMSANPAGVSADRSRLEHSTIRVERDEHGQPRSDCGRKPADVCCEHHDDVGVYFSCENAQTDRNNCGVCGRKCADSESCVAGQCGCAEGESRCGGGCASLKDDAANCGSYGHKCAQLCEQGKRGTCGKGFTWCEGDPARRKLVVRQMQSPMPRWILLRKRTLPRAAIAARALARRELTTAVARALRSPARARRRIAKRRHTDAKLPLRFSSPSVHR